MLKAGSTSSPWSPLSVIQFWYLNPPEGSSTRRGRRLTKDSPLRPLQFSCFRTICTASGICRKVTRIIQLVGRRSSAGFPRDTCGMLVRVENATPPGRESMKLPSGSGGFGNTRSKPKKIWRSIWITFITTRSNMDWMNEQLIGRIQALPGM